MARAGEAGQKGRDRRAAGFSGARRARSRSKRKCWSAESSANGCSICSASRNQSDDFFAVLDRIGHMPLPPYIRRDDADADRERYQTVFAHERGSVAAPTAGLHFTPQMLEALAAQRRRDCARHAARGAGNVCAAARGARGRGAPASRALYDLAPKRPMRSTPPHAVAGALWPWARRWCARWKALRLRRAETGRDGPIRPHSGATEIFISPGFEFRLVGALLTNFHLPQSSLLMLVSAFAGRERVLAAYRMRSSRNTGSSATAIACFIARDSVMRQFAGSRRVFTVPAVTDLVTSVTDQAKPPVFLLDTMSFIFRAYHAMQRSRPMSTRVGTAHGGDLCLREHDQEAAPGFCAAVFCRGLRRERRGLPRRAGAHHGAAAQVEQRRRRALKT